MPTPKTGRVSVRIDADTEKLLKQATRGKGAPSRTEIIERGISLACAELKRKKSKGA